MSYQIIKMPIFTKNISEMASFLADLFDLDISQIKDASFEVQFANINLKIIEVQDFDEKFIDDIELSIDELTIKEILKRFSFYGHKRGIKLSKITDSDHIQDPDGRYWLLKPTEFQKNRECQQIVRSL